MAELSTRWYSVRCVFRVPEDGFGLYEERVTLWQAQTFDQAIALAEDEARRYAHDISDDRRAEYVGLAQSYLLSDEPGHGAEVFSLVRNSDLPADDYIDRFFDTGDERQQWL